jgi:hypothetical protein
MNTCDLPESFSSACWGLGVDPFTFHANCVAAEEQKLTAGTSSYHSNHSAYLSTPMEYWNLGYNWG